MAQITINLPENDSRDGISLATLEQHIDGRYRNVEEFINRTLADTFGYLPDGTRREPKLPGLERLFKDAGLT